jgi:hypothetical protein
MNLEASARDVFACVDEENEVRVVPSFPIVAASLLLLAAAAITALLISLL